MQFKNPIRWATGLSLAALLLGAGTARAAPILNSQHDLSAHNWGTNQVCVFCHSPHTAVSGVNQTVPLWNHATTAATYTLYSSSSLNASPTQPDSNSKACLSCHDGTVALDSYGSRVGTNFIPDSAKVGENNDLSDTHPVSFTYDAALAGLDPGLVTPASASLVVTGIPLYNSKLQCASCHAVHDPQYIPFLRADNAGSGLCLKCHRK